jgi:CheY-like chemotaxis protein
MKSMLIIDGSSTLAELFAEIFDKRGWKVVTCSDRECAIGRLAGNQLYHAILLSDRVPGTSGVQLVRMIRALEHRRIIAVVMVTGSAEVTEGALAAGADEVLVKPINPNALVWAVDKHVV